MQARQTMAALGVALALAAAAPAEAQFGGLGRRIGEKVAEKAAGKAVDKAADRAGIGGGGESGGASAGASYTPEKVDQFIAIVTPAVEQARRVTAWQEASKAFEAKKKARQECINRMGQTITTPPVSVDEELNRFTERQQQLMARMNSGTPAERAVVIDSLEIVGEAMTLAMYPQLKQCGERPAFPGLEPERVNTEAIGQRAREAGFSQYAFGMMRERIAAWVLTGSTEGLSPDAVATLQAREAPLKGLAPYFTAVSWTSWGDLGDW
jgi:hypothetical protein